MSSSKPSLLVRLPNWVGDVVMCLPALKAMSDAGVQLTLLGKPWIHSLFSAMPYELITCPKEFWQGVALLRRRSEKNMLLFPNSLSSAAIARFSGKRPVAYQTDGRGILLSAGMKKVAGSHEAEYFWEIARFAIGYFFPELGFHHTFQARAELLISEGSESVASDALAHRNINDGYWVLCPAAIGRSPSGDSKVWPHWHEFATRLHQAHKQVVVCPGPGEEGLCRALLPEAIHLRGLSLDTYAAVLAGASQVVANDSGPMHLAAAVNSNVLGIFGVSDPSRTHPLNADFIGSSTAWPSVDAVLALLGQP